MKHFLDNNHYVKCPKYGVFVSRRIQSECRKIRTRKNSVFGHFPRSVVHMRVWEKSNYLKRSLGFLRGILSFLIFEINTQIPLFLSFAKWKALICCLRTLNFRLKYRLAFLQNFSQIFIFSDVLFNELIDAKRVTQPKTKTWDCEILKTNVQEPGTYHYSNVLQ